MVSPNPPNVCCPKIMRKKPVASTSPASMDTSEDTDAEEALKGFDFLSSPDDMDTSPESRGPGDGTDWGESRGPFSSMRHKYGAVWTDVTIM